MTSRQGAFTSDAVGIITGQGDRIDRLERTRSDPGAPELVASYFPITDLPDGDPVRVGKLTLPRGYSRITVAAFFAPNAGTLNGVGILFPPGWEEEHVLIGGFTNSGNELGNFVASGVGILRSSTRKTSPFYARAYTDPVGVGARGSGVIFIEPVDSLALG